MEKRPHGLMFKGHQSEIITDLFQGYLYMKTFSRSLVFSVTLQKVKVKHFLAF